MAASAKVEPSSAVSVGKAAGQEVKDGQRPLLDIAVVFKALNESLKVQSEDGKTKLDLKLFVKACETINILFSLLGVAFSFAGKDFVDKVKDIKEASKQFSTAEDMMAHDIKKGTVKVRGGHTRNLLRVSRGLDLNKRLFQYLLEDETQPLRLVAGRAYEEVFSKHHSWGIRSLVSAGLLALPSAEQFLSCLREDVTSCRQPAEQFVADVDPVIKHIESMFIAEGLGTDW